MFTSGSLQLYYIIQSVVTVSTSYAKCGGLCMGHKQYTRHSSLSLFRGARFSLVLRLQLPVQRIGSTFAVSCYHLFIPGPLPVNGALPAPLPPSPSPPHRAPIPACVRARLPRPTAKSTRSWPLCCPAESCPLPSPRHAACDSDLPVPAYRWDHFHASHTAFQVLMV